MKTLVFDFFVFANSRYGVNDSNVKLNAGSDFTLGQKYLGEYLGRNYGGGSYQFICDDVMASAQEAMRERIEEELFIMEGDFFWGVTIELSNQKIIDRIVSRSSVSWHFLGVVVKEQENSELFGKNFSVSEIVLGAFDGEGFLHCLKSN